MDEQLKKDFTTYIVGKRSLAETTAKVYLTRMTSFLKSVELEPEKVTNETIVQYLSDLKINYQQNANTRRLAKTAIEVFYRWFSRYAGIENPAVDLSPIKKYIDDPRFVTPDELEILLNAINGQTKDNNFARRDCGIIALLADTGIRIEEFERLRTGDVQIVRNLKKEVTNLELHISAVKGSHARVVPFARLVEGDLCSEYFIRYFTWLLLEKQQEKNQPLFFPLKSRFRQQDEPNKALLRTGVNKALIRARKLAGMDKNVTPHTLRHFYGTYSYINGMDLHTIQLYMGHARITTTMRYIHVAERLIGKGLAHSATLNLNAPLGAQGYVNMLREFMKK